MDLSDVRNIEFLDLSDVDEVERIKVKTSLREDDASVQLPWFKTNQKSLQGERYLEKSRELNELSTAYTPCVSTHLIPTAMVNNVFINQEHHFHQHPDMLPAIVPGYVPPGNVFCYVDAVSPVSTPYTQSVFIQGPTEVPLASKTAVNSYSPNNSYSYPNTTVPQSKPSNPSTLQNGITSANENHLLHSQNLQQNKNSGQAAQCIDLPNNAKKLNQTAAVNGVQKTNAQPATRTWASLFNTKKSNDATNNIEAQGKKIVPIAEECNSHVCPLKNPSNGQFIDPDCYRMGEYLLSHVVDGKAVSIQPRGLLNRSNYCYVNCILQALIACPPLYNLLSGLSQNMSSNGKRKPTPVIDGMCRFVNEFKPLPANSRMNNRRSNGKNVKKDQGVMITTDIPFEPFWVYKMLNHIRTDLTQGRQEDAEEFLGCLLNGLNDEMLELLQLVKNDCDPEPKPETNTDNDIDKEWQVMGPKNKGSVTRRTEFGKTPISDIFGGFLRSRIHRTGDHVTENIQPFFTLQLNIMKVNTVREALEGLTIKYQLEGLTSSKTNEKVDAWQQVILDELPVILILHLKCFDYKMNGCKKILKTLDFPVDLKIDSKIISSKSLTPKEKQYKLFAVVYHDGREASKGHYVTDAFHIGYGCWLRYDDASVKVVQEEHVLKPQGTRIPYLLFYRRCDTIKSK